MGEGKSIGDLIKDKVKMAAKHAGKAILNAIKPFLPYIAMGLGVLLVFSLILCLFVDFGTIGVAALGDASNSYYPGLDVNKTTLTREEFIKAVEGYSSDEIYVEKFAQYAEKIYDICTSKNINPILCVAQAGQESNFGKQVPTNSPWNYWGLGVYNDSNVGKEFSTIDDAINYYCDLVLGYQQEGSVACEKAKLYAEHNNKITGNMSSIYDIYCAYMYLGDYHSGKIWDDVNAKTYLVDYMHFDCTHSESDPTTLEEQAAYVVDYIDNHMVDWAIRIFGEEAIRGKYNSDFYGGIKIYNSDGSVNLNAIQELDTYLTRDLLNTIHHFNNGINQNGPLAKWWANTGFQNFQCTWWANGRASQYLELNGTKYKAYPTKQGNGGDYYNVNATNGYFNYGTTPRRNSIISWSKSGDYGHVAYVEAVDSNGDIWISHAGGGVSWFGVSKVTKESGYAPASGGGAWSGYKFNGFIYLDEPQ